MLTKILEFIMIEFGNRVTKYVDKPNELDTGFRDLEKKVTDIGFRNTAAVDMIKEYAEKIDNITDKVKATDKVVDQLSDNMKSANKELNKFKDAIEEISKIAHPPAIPLKDIDELKESVKDVKWMMGIFSSMKKMPLLKSIFK